jgi:hypothetical protein
MDVLIKKYILILFENFFVIFTNLKNYEKFLSLIKMYRTINMFVTTKKIKKKRKILLKIHKKEGAGMKKNKRYLMKKKVGISNKNKSNLNDTEFYFFVQILKK